jgi:hypothetical protein
MMLGATSIAAQVSPGSITGAVVDAEGSAIANATITTVSPASFETKTSETGEFVLGGLPPGTYTLRVQEPGFRTRDSEVRLEAGKETSLGRFLLEVKSFQCLGNANKPRISEVMQPVGDEPAVFGTARGDRGTAVEDVTIRLLMLGTSNVIAAAQSDQKGEFQFSGIKPGAYYLEISVDGHVVTGAKLRVRKGHPLAVVLTWQPLRPGEFCL